MEQFEKQMDNTTTTHSEMYETQNNKNILL